jgi:hypothetical protein
MITYIYLEASLSLGRLSGQLTCKSKIQELDYINKAVIKLTLNIKFKVNIVLVLIGGHAVSWLVEALCYKLEGFGFDSQ